MHVIDRTDAFTLIGSDARRGKLTLFDAEGPRSAARSSTWRCASRSSPSRRRSRSARCALELVEAPTDVEYDLDHVALYSRTPEETAQAYLQLGFEQAG